MQEKTHLRMSAFPGLFIFMVATYVAFVAFMIERLRAMEALGRLLQIVKKNCTRKRKSTAKVVHLLALEGGKHVRTVHAAMNIAANNSYTENKHHTTFVSFGVFSIFG